MTPKTTNPPTTREQAEQERAERIAQLIADTAKLADEHIKNLPPYPTVTNGKTS